IIATGTGEDQSAQKLGHYRDVESLCLLGFVMTDNHMVRVVFRVPVTNLLPAACPGALCGICPRAEREREKRGLAAAVGRRVTPKYSELTPK
uniref:hypothetical protein n=1 Tax=uncultured Bifidobacterium sp. TaxID=165187 RepID=UPI00259A61B2